MDIIQRREIERDIHDIIVRFGQYSDHRESRKVADLYTENAVVGHGANSLSGREEIFDAIEKRRATSINRHVAGNTMIDIKDENHAEAVTYYISFTYDSGDQPLKLPAPLHQPFSMGEWHFQFIRASEGWLISRRETKRLFERTGA